MRLTCFVGQGDSTIRYLKNCRLTYRQKYSRSDWVFKFDKTAARFMNLNKKRNLYKGIPTGQISKRAIRNAFSK